MWSKPSTSAAPKRPNASPLPDSQCSHQGDGKRYSQIIKLRPGVLEAYKKAHDAIWPEVAEQIRDSQIQDYSIAYDPETSILFATFRYVGSDFDADMTRMRANRKIREWWKMTDAWQESLVPGAVSSESGDPSWWKPIEQVFYQA